MDGDDVMRDESAGGRGAEIAAKVMGGLLAVIVFVGGGAVWLLTTIGLWLMGETGFALLAFFVPPADLILSFMVSPILGVVGVIAALIAIIAGSSR